MVFYFYCYVFVSCLSSTFLLFKLTAQLHNVSSGSSLQLLKQNLEVLYHSLYLPLRLPEGDGIKSQPSAFPNYKILDFVDTNRELGDSVPFTLDPPPGILYHTLADDPVVVKIRPRAGFDLDTGDACYTFGLDPYGDTTPDDQCHDYDPVEGIPLGRVSVLATQPSIISGEAGHQIVVIAVTDAQGQLHTLRADYYVQVSF